MSKLKVCVVVDVEGFISFKRGNPRWNSWQRFKGWINNKIKRLRYCENGFNRIFPLILKERFPISFMFVGSLFKPQGKEDFIDFGYHTLNHWPLTLLSDERVEEEVKNIYNAISFSPPLWMVEDVKNPERIFKILKRNDYKIIVYRGTDDGIKCQHYDDILPVIKKYGIKCVHKSNDFQGNSSKKHMKKIFREIYENRNKNAVYCITTHDFVHKNLKNFKWLIDVLKDMQYKGIIEIVNLAELA